MSVIGKGKETSDRQVEFVVVPFHPQTFQLGLSTSALEFVDNQKAHGNNFQLSPLIAEQTGISKFKEDQIAAEVEEKTLAQMKLLQEKAYQEGYSLGLKEGAEKAFEETKTEIESNLAALEQLINSLGLLRRELVKDHEKEIMQLIFDISKKIIFREVSIDPSLVKELLIGLIDGLDVDGKIQIKLAPRDYQFVEDLLKRKDKKLTQADNISIEADEQIDSGGCLIETNYGSIDATIQQRLDSAWDVLRAKLPSTLGDNGLIVHKGPEDGNESE